MNFAQKAFDFSFAQMTFEDKLGELGAEFERIGWDYYDMSLELHDVLNDYRLSEEALTFIYDSGFIKVYVNHCNGWQTHYHIGGNPKGWRRKTHPGGYMEMSYRPETWTGPDMDAKFEQGIYTVVPDAINP